MAMSGNCCSETESLLSSDNSVRGYNTTYREGAYHVNSVKLPSNQSDVTSTHLGQDGGTQQQSSNRWTRTQKIHLSLLLTTLILVFTGYAMIAPFYPRLAKSKGFTDTHVGLVFACFQVVMCIMNPVYGSLIETLTLKWICSAGTFLCGGSCALFGILNFTNGTTFITFSFLIRIAEGNGAALYTVAATSLLMKAFPQSKGTISSLIEMSYGTGCIAGPAIGSALFDLGGYFLPFVVVGTIMITFAILMLYFLPDTADVGTPNKGFRKLLKIPGIIIIYMHTCVSAGALAYVDPVVSDWMVEKFSPQINAANVGFVFGGWSACYAISSLLIGKLSDRGFVYSTMIIGLIGSGVFYLAVGPSPLLPFLLTNGKQTVALMLSSLMMTFCFVGGTLVPSYQATTNMARLNGYEESLTTYGMVSGLMFSAISMGSAVFPTISGYVTNHYGFSWNTTVIAGVNFIMALIMICFTVSMKIMRKPLSP